MFQNRTDTYGYGKFSIRRCILAKDVVHKILIWFEEFFVGSIFTIVVTPLNCLMEVTMTPVK